MVCEFIGSGRIIYRDCDRRQYLVRVCIGKGSYSAVFGAFIGLQVKVSVTKSIRSHITWTVINAKRDIVVLRAIGPCTSARRGCGEFTKDLVPPFVLKEH